MKSKVIVIHLPQFHEIPENNEWWGDGFTEWTNVRRGRPFYPGHYQPRVPLQNNYYDLSDLSVLENQITMARQAGIFGFAFYHYYFTGKKLLEKPIEQYRDYSKENFPYCLIWANQSWARTWYRTKLGQQVLLEQVYGSEKEWRQHFEYLLTFFKDERYIKIDNKPIYIMYLPQDIECRKEMFQLWNNWAKEEGFSGVYLIAMETSYGKDKHSILYDAYMRFEPLHMFRDDNSYRNLFQEIKAKSVEKLNIQSCSFKNWIYAKNSFSYNYLCKQIEKEGSKYPSKKYYLGTFAGWDNTARKDGDGTIVIGSNPRKFGKHVERMLSLSEQIGNEYLFLNAWNEWSEGAYIEPDEKYGNGYLEELKKAVIRYENK